jgi:alpha-tubulin suppressor-like RCC1 family protein
VLLSAVLVQVDAGHSHTAALTSGGDLFMWGSGASGKLGLGHITTEFECFAPLPTVVRFPSETSKVSEVDVPSSPPPPT